MTTVNAQPKLTPLSQEVRTALPTTEACAHLNRQPQTLRGWHCFDNGPIKAILVNGRLHWPVSDLKRLLAGEAPELRKHEAKASQKPIRVAVVAQRVQP
jgi:hypothetical protein